MVSMWFKHETNFVTMIDLVKIMKEELDKVNGQNVKAKARAMLPNGPKGVGGDESEVIVFYGKLQISFLVGGDIVAKFTREGHADEGRVIDMMLCQKHVSL